jgi:hypothetical protein
VQVGDLVKYKHLDKELGIIVEKATKVVPGGRTLSPLYKVVWCGPTANLYSTQQWDWMVESGLELISDSQIKNFLTNP